MTPIEIEQYYNSRLLYPFPYRDCRWLAERACIDPGDLIPELDMYNSNIADYASSATGLQRRFPEQFSQALHSLQKDVGTTYPTWGKALEFVTAEETPDLHARVETLQVLRLALIAIFEKLIWQGKVQIE